MAICQDMIKAFMLGWENDHYGEKDLREGIQYCRDLIKFQHRKYDPFHHYKLNEFIAWAENKLKNI
jgi:hypothetical protein